MKNLKPVVKQSGNKKSSRVKIFSVLLATLIIASTLLVVADRADISSPLPGANILGASKGIKLGESGLEISTPEDLEALATLVNSGKEHKDVRYVLTEDITLNSLEKWESIGTKKHPFKGIFNGNGFQITGVGQSPFTNVFGYLDGATLKDIIVITKNQDPTDNLFAGLFVESKDSTIEGCHVLKEGMSFAEYALATGNVEPTTDWYNPNARSPMTINSYSDLKGVAQMIETGNARFAATDFAGQTLILGDIDASESANEFFPGLGSSGNPFNGNVDGGTVRNLTMKDTGQKATALFPVVGSPVTSGGANETNTSINNISLLNVNIEGGDNVGAIVGLATNTDITNCSSSGTIRGNISVGGIVGKSVSDGTSVPISGSWINNSYSTADITGVKEVGGIVGTTDYANATLGIDMVFSTGTLNGSLQVGGIVGLHINKGDITNASSSSTINTTSSSGGIVGEALDSPTITIENSYFAGTIKGVTGLGGLSGKKGDMKNSYVSGHVIAPNAQNGLVGAISGDISGISTIDSNNVYADLQAVYSPINILNIDSSDNAYGKGSTGSNSYSTFNNQKATPGSNIDSFGDFTGKELKYYDQPGASSQRIVDSGQYPVNNNFAASSSASFKTYSQLSTLVSYTSVPNKLYFSNGKASSSKNGSAYGFPSDSTLGSWVFENGKTSIDVPDASAKDGKITLTIAGNNIAMSEAFGSNNNVTLHFKTVNPGLSLQYNIEFVDEKLAYDVAKFDENVFYFDNDSNIKDTQKVVGKLLTTYFIEFNEPIELINPDVNGKGTVPLIRYQSYENFNNKANGTTTSAEIKVVGGDTLRILWDKTDIDFNNYYTLDFATALASGSNSSFQDMNSSAPNKWDKNLHFKSVNKTVPTLYFGEDTVFVGNTYIETTPNKQTVRYTENNPLLTSFWMGVSVDADPYFAPGKGTNPKATKTAKADVGGKFGYPTLDETNWTNFYEIPGTYEVVYQDEDGAGTPTNKITRIYQIDGKAKVTKDNKPVTTLFIDFDAKQMQQLFALKEKLGSVPLALEQMVSDLYLTSSALPSNKLTAVYVSHNGKEENLDIKFDFSKFDEKVFENGFLGNGYYDAGGQAFPYILSMSGVQVEYEIQLVNESYQANRDVYKKNSAIKHFGAKVVDRATGDEVPGVQLKYNFRDIDSKAYGIAQEVEISIPETDYEVQGVNMFVNTYATVIIDKNLKWKHPEDKEDVSLTFWTPVLDKVRRSANTTNWSFEIPFEAAELTPTDFFIVVQNQKDANVDLKFASGIEMNFKHKNMQKELIERMDTSIAMEPMYDLAIRRDGHGIPVQQFRSLDKIEIPGKVTVTIPLEDHMNTTGLALYLVDEKTNTYKFLETIEDSQIVDGKLLLEMTKFQGKYVITSADFAGETVGKVTTVGIVPATSTKAATSTKKSTAKNKESQGTTSSTPSLEEPPLPEENNKNQPAKIS